MDSALFLLTYTCSCDRRTEHKHEPKRCLRRTHCFLSRLRASQRQAVSVCEHEKNVERMITFLFNEIFMVLGISITISTMKKATATIYSGHVHLLNVLQETLHQSPLGPMRGLQQFNTIESEEQQKASTKHDV